MIAVLGRLLRALAYYSANRQMTIMNRWRSNLVALLSATAAFATSAFAQAQDIHVVDVPLVTSAQIQFFRLRWPSTRFLVRQDHSGQPRVSLAQCGRRFAALRRLRFHARSGQSEFEEHGFYHWRLFDERPLGTDLVRC